MRVIALVTSLAVVVGLLAGCGSGFQARPDLPYRMLRKARTPVMPPSGFLYSGYKAPLDAATGEIGTKTGRAASYQIGLPPLPFPGLEGGVDLVAWGDASPEHAAERAGITEVTQMDYEFNVIFLFIRRFVTEVHGN